MSVLVNKDSKVIVQGFTGSEGTFHAGQMIEYGTNVVGGVTPSKGGQTHLDKPVFNSVEDAVNETGADVSIIFVPPAFAADAIMEAADAGIKVIITITEGIPIKDMVVAKEYIQGMNVTLIGPNCPGVITPDEAKVGIMPGFVFKKGKVGLVSKSGTLTYEAADQLAKAGLGISTAIGIGGDPIIGTPTKSAVQLLMEDDETEAKESNEGKLWKPTLRWPENYDDLPPIERPKPQKQPLYHGWTHSDQVDSWYLESHTPGSHDHYNQFYENLYGKKAICPRLWDTVFPETERHVSTRKQI